MSNISATTSSKNLRARELVAAWYRILAGSPPMLSIEITKECPLSCPGCYAYNQQHLGGAATLRDLSDFRGEELVRRVLALVKEHRPLHVSIVGGEPLMRRRELEKILPQLSQLGVFTLLVTSAVAPIPAAWMEIPRLRVTVSVDGLPEHHDIRRKPATYERILKNIAGRQVNIHLTITRPMVHSAGYLREYFAFWSARPEVNHIWVSTYTPQVGEETCEMLTRSDRATLFQWMPGWQRSYPKLLMTTGMVESFARPPQNPADCTFAKMSLNYSADLSTRVEPCILGGVPDCSQCGCAASVGFHSLRQMPLIGPLKIGHLVNASVAVGATIGRLRRSVEPDRWRKPGSQKQQLIQLRLP
ncbi:MAG TPA: radical SAM protein [Terriglobales bacterium]|nr:radical SAM protein [Terriglobales bacterium]